MYEKIEHNGIIEKVIEMVVQYLLECVKLYNSRIRIQTECSTKYCAEVLKLTENWSQTVLIKVMRDMHYC